MAAEKMSRGLRGDNRVGIHIASRARFNVILNGPIS